MTQDGRHIRVIVIEEHRAFAEALAVRLSSEADLRVVAVVAGCEDICGVLTAHEAEVVIVDEELGGRNGAALVAELRAGVPGMRVIVLSTDLDGRHATISIRAGAAAWVSKDSSIDHLLTVIHTVCEGGTWVPPRLLTRVLADLMHDELKSSERTQVLRRLTRRECEVLTHMTRGLERDEIAEQMFVSTNTVRTHVQNVLRKLGVHSSLAAVAVARRIGLSEALEDLGTCQPLRGS